MGDFRNLIAEKNHTGVQFLKYSICGGFAFGVDLVVFFLVAWFWFPSLTENDFLVRLLDLEVENIPRGLRTLNFVLGSLISFMASNLTAYILNVLFVFKSGRHNRWKEMVLFYLVSGFSVGFGVLLGVILINGVGLSTTFSYVAKALSAVLINYIARKFFVFKG